MFNRKVSTYFGIMAGVLNSFGCLREGNNLSYEGEGIRYSGESRKLERKYSEKERKEIIQKIRDLGRENPYIIIDVIDLRLFFENQ